MRLYNRAFLLGAGHYFILLWGLLEARLDFLGFRRFFLAAGDARFLFSFLTAARKPWPLEVFVGPHLTGVELGRRFRAGHVLGGYGAFWQPACAPLARSHPWRRSEGLFSSRR